MKRSELKKLVLEVLRESKSKRRSLKEWSPDEFVVRPFVEKNQGKIEMIKKNINDLKDLYDSWAERNGSAEGNFGTLLNEYILSEIDY